MTTKNGLAREFEHEAQFIAFLEKARSLLQSSTAKLGPAPAICSQNENSEFQLFLDKARPLVVDQIRTELRKHHKKFSEYGRWLIPESCDLLAVAGMSGLEDQYTNLLAWCLWPKEQPDLALLLQKKWLSSLGLSDLAKTISVAVEPQTQLQTDDGRPDLVMHFSESNFLLVLEAKTYSQEHETPSSKMQTVSYPSAVRRKLKLDANYRCEMVFLTLSRIEAENLDAINTTYEDFVSTLTEALPHFGLTQELKSSYALLISHLLAHAIANGENRAKFYRDNLNEISHPDLLNDKQILENLRNWGELCRKLHLEARK